MKKLILICILVASYSYSQNAFMEYQFKAKRGTQAAILALTDDFWGDADFKSGGINVEAMSIGNPMSSHRVVLYGDPSNWGRKDSISEDKWQAFIQKLNNHVEKWTHSSSGNVLSWVGGTDDYKYVQIYEFSATDPMAFQAAHDKIVKEMSGIMGERAVGFGTYEIGGYRGASHWVAVSYKNWEDLILTGRDLQKKTKAWQEYYSKRGQIKAIRNYTLNIAKAY